MDNGHHTTHDAAPTKLSTNIDVRLIYILERMSRADTPRKLPIATVIITAGRGKIATNGPSQNGGKVRAIWVASRGRPDVLHALE